MVGKIKAGILLSLSMTLNHGTEIMSYKENLYPFVRGSRRFRADAAKDIDWYKPAEDWTTQLSYRRFQGVINAWTDA